MALIGIFGRAWFLFLAHPGAASVGDWFPIGAFTFWLPGYLDWFALGMAMAVGSTWLSLGGRVPNVVALLGRRPWLSWLLAGGCLWLVVQLHLGVFVNSNTFSSTQAFFRFTFTGLAGALFVLPAVFGPQRQGWIRALLRHPIMVGLGLISYGIYLWHFPIWDLVLDWHTDWWFHVNGAPIIGVVLAGTLIVAALSYVVVERPIILWSTGRAAPRFRDLKIDRTTDSPLDEGTKGAPARRGSSERLVVALVIVAIAVVGLFIGSRDLNAHASARRVANAGIPDGFHWQGPRSKVWDDFAHPDQVGLGDATSGQAWQLLSGTWSIANGQATAAPNVAPSFAVVRVAGADRSDVRTTVPGTTARTGLAFRCQDAQNCFWVEALPTFGTWNVRKIVAGKITGLGNIGIATSDPGTAVAVHTDGDRISVAINGRIRKSFTDPDLRGANGIGLARGPGGTTASTWIRFEGSTGPPTG